MTETNTNDEQHGVFGVQGTIHQATFLWINVGDS